MHFRVQRLHAPAQHLRPSGQVGNVAHSDSRFAQQLGRAARGNNLDPARGQLPHKFRQAQPCRIHLPARVPQAQIPPKDENKTPIVCAEGEIGKRALCPGSIIEPSQQPCPSKTEGQDTQSSTTKAGPPVLDWSRGGRFISIWIRICRLIGPVAGDLLLRYARLDFTGRN